LQVSWSGKPARRSGSAGARETRWHPPRFLFRGEEGKRFGLPRLESAAAVALQIQSPTLTSIRSILRTGRDKSPPPAKMPMDSDQGSSPTSQAHANIRGSDYYR
jgi:hypothetical protein